MTKPNPLPKAIALILASLGTTFMLVRMDAVMRAKTEAMSDADIVQHQHSLYHHGFLFHFFMVLVMGGFFVGSIELIAYLIRLPFNRTESKKE